MKGFVPKFRDFPDFIIGITKEIWEDRRISVLHHHYSSDIVVRAPGSVVVGSKGVIGATMATLAEFPDRALLAEDVIWSGSPEEGMLSSHRILTTATHLGDGAYGRATGKKLCYRVIADCHAINDQINDEWLIRDTGAIVRQMGWDPRDFARDQIAREGGPDKCTRPMTPANDVPGPYKGRGNSNEWGARHADLITRIMSADMAAIPATYDRASNLFLPGGVVGFSHSDADRFWMSLRSAFPDAKLSIDHVIGREDPMMPPRSAVRWSLHGKHSGWGAWGAPTGAEVYILGICQAEWGPWGLRRDYVHIDETAIWKQILLHTGEL